MPNFISPLSKSNNISNVKLLNVKKIINEYRKFDIDVSNYFQNLQNISILRCDDTGYQFYYPYNISGDSNFYEHFQKFDWYYMPWKWEHEITLDFIKPGMKILEVGCAQGAFLNKISGLFNLETVIGLELNKSAEKKNKKWQIKNQTIEDFASSNSNTFDMVCSFQVLEHISDVYSFLNAQIVTLKTGGTLIISVPNNDSFIKNLNGCLNMPPHHMGLWDEKSLKALENIFTVQLIKVHKEVLQDYHIGSYIEAVHYAKYPKILRKILRTFNYLIGVYGKQEKKVRAIKSQLLGHTILVAFNKI